MMRTKYFLSACAMLTLCFSGCADPDANSGGNDSSSSYKATDAWLGQWNGPEGTYLRLEGGGGEYKVTIQNLDGPQSYQGNSTGTQIHFDRNGVKESIHATNGAETGMKWLGDKANCLTIRLGEGYCRD